MTTLQEALDKLEKYLEKPFMIRDDLAFSQRHAIDGIGLLIEPLRTALAQQGERRCTYCDGTGDVHGIDGEWRGTCPCAAAPAPQAQESAEWRTEAVKWIRRKAEDQWATNEQNPRHTEAYPSWGERVRQWHWLADDLEMEQNSPPFGLESYQEPAPQAQPAPLDVDAYRNMNGEL